MIGGEKGLWKSAARILLRPSCEPQPWERSRRWGEPWVWKLIPAPRLFLLLLSLTPLMDWWSGSWRQPLLTILLLLMHIYFYSRKINVESTIEIFQANVEPHSKYVAETPLSKQTTGKHSLETNSSCHHLWAVFFFSSFLSNSVCNKTCCSNGLVV